MIITTLMKYSAFYNVQREILFESDCFLIQVHNIVRLKNTTEECLLNNLIVGDNPSFPTLVSNPSNFRTTLALLKSRRVVQVRNVSML